MAVQALICDPGQVEQLIRRRREAGTDRYDEVWEGLYVMCAMPSLEHQRLVAEFTTVLTEAVMRPGRGVVYPGANVTDREEDWEDNYRCPDVVVVLRESAERCRDVESALLGGPDFLIAVRSPGDKTLDKLEFYSSIGVRELLVVDRDSKAMTLFRLADSRLCEAAMADEWLISDTVRMAFRTRPDEMIEIRTTDSHPRTWVF